MQRIGHYLILARFHRPIGSLLLLWPTLIALWMAGEGNPSWQLIGVFVGGVFTTRAAGCVINDMVDRDYDLHVERTRTRPLTARQVSLWEAIGIILLLLAIALGLVLMTNRFTLQLALIGAMLMLIYPWMKRVTRFPQFVLGCAFAWGVPMAYAAQDQPLSLTCWLLFSATFCWIVAYDTLYAMADREDDKKIGVHSTAITWEHYDKQAITFFHFLALNLFVAAGIFARMGIFYFVGILIAAGFILYQLRLIRARNPHAAFQAFLNNQWVGGAIFAGTLLDSGIF